MKRSVFALFIVGTIVTVPAQPAWACTCTPATPPVKAGWADVIFTGLATELDPDPSKGAPVFTYWTTFEVTATYKGDVGPVAAVETGGHGASCGVRFTEGERYTVFARAQEDGLDTDICSGTSKGEIDPGAYGLTARPPIPGETRFAPEGESPSWLWTFVAVGGVLLFGVVLAIRWRRRLLTDRGRSSRQT
jgi:hypothetical protein